MQAEDSWPFFFFFFPKLFSFLSLTETFSETFPMVRFEPGTFHSASEHLNHSAIPQTMIKICQMVLKGVDWLDNTSHVIWSWKDSIGCTMITLGQMVLKGTYWVRMIKFVLKGVNWVHNTKIRSYGLEKSQLGTQYKYQLKWSWKESLGYTVIKWCQMVLKEVNWVHYNKIRLNGLERSQ